MKETKYSRDILQIVTIGLTGKYLLNNRRSTQKSFTKDGEKIINNENIFSKEFKNIKKDTVIDLKDNYKNIKSNILTRLLNILKLKENTEETDINFDYKNDNNNYRNDNNNDNNSNNYDFSYRQDS